MITNEVKLFKIAEIEVKYSTKVKASDRIKVNTSCAAADAFRELWNQLDTPDKISSVRRNKLTTFRRSKWLGFAGAN